jgi:hypothetical protein
VENFKVYSYLSQKLAGGLCGARSTHVGNLRFGFVFTPNSILTFSHREMIY